MPHSSLKRRVLVMGAGSSGLAAVQQALEAGLEPVCFEARPGIGGAWRYDPEPGDKILDWDDDGWCSPRCPGEGVVESSLTSPMYRSLRTNVPTSLMQYRGRPFPPTTGLYCEHQQVQEYLEDFAEPYLPYIRFNTRIVSLRHTLPSDEIAGPARRWLASFRSTATQHAPVESETFDAVFVANGHYARPYIPYVEGLRSFPAEISHSRWYREADQYKNKTVLVIGNSASGYDITRELAASIYDRRQDDPSAELPRIYQSARSPPALGIPWDAPDAPPYSKEVQTFPPIKEIAGKHIEFQDGRSIDDVEVIMFATGYHFSFPFCDPSTAPFSSHPLTYAPTKTGERGPPSAAGGMRVHNLDDRMCFYLPDPTLAFLALPYLTIPFPLAQLQARLAALHFASSSRLPAPLAFVPDPSTADEHTGEPDGAPETRKPVTWGHPKQYDEMDRWMRESGDVPVAEDMEAEVRILQGCGGATGKANGKEEDGGLTGERSPYGLTSQAERDLRVGAKALRKAVLGY
ncbi:flavin-containing monooxygenase [Rhodotorula paludigena]|uniref:flavin-containing monooxygenase n=1 Tax=Rhodotorula paludigena TaxID=86838 RepID=UPI003171CA97